MATLSTSERHGENSPYLDGWKAYDSNPTQNPKGWVLQRISGLSRAPMPPFAHLKELTNFQDYHGLPEFRQAVAKFMSRARGGRVTFDPDRVVMAGGATGANELINALQTDCYIVSSSCNSTGLRVTFYGTHCAYISRWHD